MKKVILFVALLWSVIGLTAQSPNWHVYRPGGFSSELCYRNSELWVASRAGIMRWNPETGQKIQYNAENSPTQLSAIYCMCYSLSGDIWVGGYYGAARYHGDSWEGFDSSNSPLPETTIQGITEDHTGAVWMSTTVGVYKYLNGVWTVFNSTNSNLPANLQTYAIAVDPQNKIWISAGSGVWCFNGSLWFQYTHSNSTLPNGQISCIAFEEDGTGWFGGSDGVAKYVNGAWQNNASLGGVDITGTVGIYVDSWQRLWFYNHAHLLCYNGISYQHYPSTLFGSYTQWFCDIFVAEDQTIWLSFLDTYSPQSLVKFDGVNFTRYPICELPLASNYVQSIFKGFDGNLWIGTADSEEIGGYLSLWGTEVETYGMYNTQMPCDHVWALAQDIHLNMWVGTCLALLRTGHNGAEIYHTSDIGVTANFINTICPVGEGVWIGSNGGVSRFALGVWSPLSQAEAGMNLSGTQAIKMDPEGRIWIGCTAGVTTYFEGQFTNYPELGNARDFAFAADGTVWVARGSLAYRQNGIWHTFDTSNSGLLANNVNCVAVDQFNVLWAGTFLSPFALYRYAEGDWRVYNSGNSVVKGSQINTIYVDEQNTKWIGSNNLILFNENGIPVETEDLLLPKPERLSSYPNPFSGSTRICYEKVSQSDAKLSIYNLKGQKVWEFSDLSQTKGKKEILWNGRDQQGKTCAAGVYLIKVSEGSRFSCHKIIKMK